MLIDLNASPDDLQMHVDSKFRSSTAFVMRYPFVQIALG
jgi:hypothetical protein